MPISLKTAIQSSYGNKKAKQKNLNEGYVKDKNLSNANQKVFYNPDTGNLLFNVAGSRTAKDFLYNDPMLALGLLKKTDRYKDAKKTLEQAKNIYQPTNTTVTGHSLAGTIGAGITSKKDKFLGFNAGYTIAQPTRSNKGMHKQYRTKGDAVSLLGLNSSNIKTLEGPKIGLSDVIGKGLLGYAKKSHLDYNKVNDIYV
jgi:hypothetical protein